MVDGGRFGRGVFIAPLTVGITGSPCVAAFRSRPTGCIVIAPVDLLFGIPDNSLLRGLFAGLFERCDKNSDRKGLSGTQLGRLEQF